MQKMLNIVKKYYYVLYVIRKSRIHENANKLEGFFS